jgi:hypothetical protein
MGCTASVVAEGNRIALWKSNGTLEIIDGPRRFRNWGSDRVEQLERYSADRHQYLEIKFKDGHKEHKRGPTWLYRDPLEHAFIQVKDALSIDSSEVLVVYREEEEKVSRSVIRGPTIHVPTADEWVHSFSWHGKDPREPQNKCRKIPGGLNFTKLRTIPDKFYYNVSEVRTSDDTLLVLKFMIFFELKDLETMLDQTHDPIGDFINSVTADIIAYAATLPYEIFIEKTSVLNQLETYPQLVSRAKQIGYRINKIVFRGYYASDTLQSMHDSAIQTRTKLRLEHETEEQKQTLEDLKLLKDTQRLTKRHDLEKQATEHENQLSRKRHEEALLQVHQKNAEDAQHLEKLRSLGVDLTKYLVAQQSSPEKLIQVVCDEKVQSKVVLNQ